MRTNQRVSGSKIKAARLKAGMSQAELAYAIHTGERNIRRWESEANTPRVSAIANIAEVLGVPINSLFASEDEAADPDPFRGSGNGSAPGDRGARPSGIAEGEVAA